MTSVKLINHSSSTADWNYSYLFIFCNIDYQTLTTHSLSHTKQKKECRKAFFRMVAIMNLTLLVLEQKTINNVAICGHIIDCCF